MTVLRFQSAAGNTFYKLTASNNYALNQTAVAVGFTFPIWPQQVVTDSIPPASNPDFIWYQAVMDPGKLVTGETIYYYRNVSLDYPNNPINKSEPFGISLNILADNAFYSRVTLIGTRANNAIDTISFDISDGSFTLATGLTETSPPYNWQNVSHTVQEIIPPDNWKALTLQFETVVANYEMPGATQQSNPAGLQYIIELTGLDNPPATVVDTLISQPNFPLPQV